MKKIITAVLALALCVLFAVPALGAQYTTSRPVWVDIDGVITEEEWGRPIYKGITLAKAEAGVSDGQLDALWYDGNTDGDVSFDLYVNNNNEHIYIGCVIHNITVDAKSDGKNLGDTLWKYQHFAFTFARYDSKYTVPLIVFEDELYEQYTGYRIAMLNDGTPVSQTMTQGKGGKELFAGSDYQIRYDSKARTMTYEVAVPLNTVYTNIYINDSTDIVFSAVIALNYENNFVSATKNGSNRFLVGTATMLKGGPRNYAHAGHSITIKLNDPKLTDELDPYKSSGTSDPGVAAVPLNDSPAISLETPGESVLGNIRLGPANIIMIVSGVLIAASLVVIIIVLVKRRKKRAAATRDGS